MILNNSKAYLVLIDRNEVTYAEMKNLSVEMRYDNTQVRGDTYYYRQLKSLEQILEKYKLNSVEIADDEIITLLKEDGCFE